MRKILLKAIIPLLGMMSTGCQTYNGANWGYNAGYYHYCPGPGCQATYSGSSCCGYQPSNMVIHSKNYLNGEYNGYGYYNQDYNPNEYNTSWYIYYNGL